MKNTLRFYRLWITPYRASAEIIKNGRPAIVLLCGLGGTSNTMSLLEGRLARDGFAPFVFPLGGLLGRINTRGIDDLADRLKERLASLREAKIVDRVAIIGHSVGGLVGRYLVSLGGGAAYVHTLITLGTPHRGSPLAAFKLYAPLKRISPGLRQIVPGSELLRELADHPPPPQVYCAALFSRSDTYCPPPTAEFDIPPGAGHISNIDVGEVGHVEFVLSEAVYDVLRNELCNGLARAGLPAP